MSPPERIRSSLPSSSWPWWSATSACRSFNSSFNSSVRSPFAAALGSQIFYCLWSSFTWSSSERLRSRRCLVAGLSAGGWTFALRIAEANARSTSSSAIGWATHVTQFVPGIGNFFPCLCCLQGLLVDHPRSQDHRRFALRHWGLVVFPGEPVPCRDRNHEKQQNNEYVFFAAFCRFRNV
jgi:hypothetical protein